MLFWIFNLLPTNKNTAIALRIPHKNINDGIKKVYFKKDSFLSLYEAKSIKFPDPIEY